MCWNNADFSSSIKCQENGTTGTPVDVIQDQQNYIVKFNAAHYRWELDMNLPSRLNLTDGIDADDEKYRLEIGADELYRHSDPLVPAGVQTVFYREIFTEYLNDDQTQDASTSVSANILRVTAKVEWFDRGKMSEVVLTTILTDYLNRKNHL
jgi:hypothetical protein